MSAPPPVYDVLAYAWLRLVCPSPLVRWLAGDLVYPPRAVRRAERIVERQLAWLGGGWLVGATFGLILVAVGAAVGRPAWLLVALPVGALPVAAGVLGAVLPLLSRERLALAMGWRRAPGPDAPKRPAVDAAHRPALPAGRVVPGRAGSARGAPAFGVRRRPRPAG